MLMMEIRMKKRAFTLIELLVVIAVIAVLMAILNKNILYWNDTTTVPAHTLLTIMLLTQT